MLVDPLDLQDGCWEPPGPNGGQRAGDLYEGVAFPDLEEFRLFVAERDGQFWTPVRFSFGVVVRAAAGFASLVPVTTAPDMLDQQKFEFLVEQARAASDFVRLPEPDGVWAGAGLALV